MVFLSDTLHDLAFLHIQWLGNWALLDSFGLFWALLGSFELFLALLGLFGLFTLPMSKCVQALISQLLLHHYHDLYILNYILRLLLYQRSHNCSRVFKWSKKKYSRCPPKITCNPKPTPPIPQEPPLLPPKKSYCTHSPFYIFDHCFILSTCTCYCPT